MDVEPQNVMNEDWQYLVILDACRYDYFKYCHDGLVDGRLERRRSPATFTVQWLERSFTDYYDDVAYISPVPFCRNARMEQKGYVFDGRKHFRKVFYLPDFTPEKTTETALKKAIQHPDWRFIIHYMCPHAPYRSVDHREEDVGVEGVSGEIGKMIWRMKMFLAKVLMKTAGNEFVWKLKQLMDMPAYSMEAVWREVGTKGIKEAYVDELILGLKHVKKLSQYLPPSKMVVTADHGELLGEKGYWGHGNPKPPLPELTDVPWLEVSR